MNPKDRNGSEITIGARAILMKKDMGDLLKINGKVGTVRAIKEHTMFDQKLRVRVSDGPEDNCNWSAWALPNEIVVVEGRPS